MASNTAVVFLAHVWHEVLGSRFERMRRESAGNVDCYVLLQDDRGPVTAAWQAHLASMGAADSLVLFSREDLPAQLGFRYFGIQRILANAHFPLMWFSRSHAYDYYWQIECDAEYRGDWGRFFDAYTPSDATLVASHFHSWFDWPDWFWWPSITLPPGLRQDQLYKAFMAVMRISKAGLECVGAAHRLGWLGHFEAVVPTVLLLDGHRLEDLNTRTACYQGAMQDPCPLLPLQSTIRCRPPITLNEFQRRGDGPLMFHPIKDAWTFDGREVVVWPDAEVRK